MSKLIIDKCVIKEDMRAILKELKQFITDGKLKDIRYRSDNVRVTCPVHKSGHESRPSCDIYIGNSSDLVFGTWNCFTCGAKGQLYDFVAECTNQSVAWAKRWLKDNFTEQTLENIVIPIEDAIILDKKAPVKKLNNNILDKYQTWHPYMQKRHLSKDVCKRFDLRYDPESQCVVFPVRDIKGNLKFLTRRSVNSKKFIIDKSVKKEVYLLDEIVKEGIKEVYVCESQINALTLWGWGYPSVALLGTGDEYQYNQLKKAGILKYNLCFDGDDAGKNGVTKFIQNISQAFITVINIPTGKDVNDLSKETFDNLERLEYK